MSFAAGVCGGLFPILGVTTPVTMLAAFLSNCNVVVALVVNLCLTPVNLATIIPFIRLGCTFLGAKPLPLSINTLSQGFKDDFMGTVSEFGAQILYGIFAWAVLLPFLACGGYFLSLPLTRYIVKKYRGPSP